MSSLHEINTTRNLYRAVLYFSLRVCLSVQTGISEERVCVSEYRTCIVKHFVLISYALRTEKCTGFCSGKWMLKKCEWVSMDWNGVAEDRLCGGLL